MIQIYQFQTGQDALNALELGPSIGYYGILFIYMSYLYIHTDTHIHGMSRLSRMCVSNTESCFSTSNEVILLTIFSKSGYLDSQWIVSELGAGFKYFFTSVWVY